MIMTKKKACMGCAALKKGDGFYECLLKIDVEFEIKGAHVTSPIPGSKCPKPKAKEDIKSATELVERYNKKQEKKK
jgi:hypothetical protein